MPVIAMPRQPGCLGFEVADGVAERMGLKIVHFEAVAGRIAERLGVQEGPLLRYVDGSACLFERLAINKRKLARFSTEEILTAAQPGGVLIYGWGAAALLRDLPDVIGVRVCASMNFRVQVMMGRLGSSNGQAVREDLERFDAAQAHALRASFDIALEDPSLFHLVLNTDRLPEEACVNAVCRIAEHPRFRDRAVTRTKIADKLLESKVNAALTEEIGARLAPAGVAVSVANGRITLIAATSSGALREQAEKIAHRVSGTRHIDNRIVSLPGRGGGGHAEAARGRASRVP
jgi:cytidylate kinase